MDLLVAKIIGLLVAAISVALIARRLHLPYTVGLVAAGGALALTLPGTGIALTHDVIFDVILPPLLFEAAIAIHWPDLRRDALPVLTLAILGTLLSAAILSAGLIYLLHWPSQPALLLGVLLAATDPVSVIAMFKDNAVTGRLRLLVESESLFNDGVAAVLFALVLTLTQAGGAPVSHSTAALFLLQTVGGGLATGLAVAACIIAVAGRTADHLVESTLTTIAAYFSFLLAEHLGASGVLATVASGLLIGNAGLNAQAPLSGFSERSGNFVPDLWEFIAFIANSLVFLLIGLTVASIPFKTLGAGALAAIIVLVLLGRALTVYPLCLAFTRSRWAIPITMQHVLWWGGLRGALGLALALSLPAALPLRAEIVIATFGVVVFSVVIQGLTMPVLMRRLRITSYTKPP